MTVTLTADRIRKLDEIGFLWPSIDYAPVSWEGRFQEMMNYYEMNGRWPTQSMGRMGDWIQKQRGLYAKRDASFMKKRFFKASKERS